MYDIDDLLITGAPIHSINARLADGQRTLTYKALACKYHCNFSQAGSSRSICALTALNCVRLAFQLEAEEGDEETLLQSFVSQAMVNQIMNIVNDLSFNAHLGIDDLLEVPLFKETIISRVREECLQGVETFKDLFIRSFPPDSLKPITAVVFTQAPEHLVCFRFQSFGSCIFVIFDAHSRSEHPFGPAFILANDVDIIATHFNQLLTQASISQPVYKQGTTANTYSYTALVIEPREQSSSIDVRDLLMKSVAYLSESPGNVDHTVSDHLEQLRVRAETLRTQKMADAAHKQDNDRQTSHTRLPTPIHKKDVVPSTKSTRRSEFGWQINLLQPSGTPPAVDPENNKDPNLPESPIPCTGPDAEDVDISLIGASKADKENVPSPTLSHMRSRTEFGWQIALQQPLKTDRRKHEGAKVLDIMTSAQVDIQMHGVPLGEEKVEVSDTQTFPKGSESAWQDALVKQLQEEEELAASSSKYVSREGVWLLTLQKRLRAEEDKVNNAVASSSLLSHGELDQKLAYHDELDFKPLPSIESENSTIHRSARHSPIFTSYLDAIQRPNRGFATLEIPTSEFPAETHECGVCNELYGVTQIIQLPMCTHAFCRECLRTFTQTKISEGRYPIFCPVCAIERTRVNQSHITQEIMERLQLSKQDFDKLNALQLVAYSVTLHCPKCKQTMNVDREEYSTQRTIICPLPACRHKWCKECLRPLASSQTQHNCKQHGFERLMRRKGWKYCPGCNTPVQKEMGCNHMTCGSPGCNVHFCYKCGISIIDTSSGGDVGAAVTEHYVNCVMFEKRRRCTIQ